MTYAKLIDNKLIYWRGCITENGNDIFTNDPTPFGYKILSNTTPESKEGYYPVQDGWLETETEITEKWAYELLPDIEATEEN